MHSTVFSGFQVADLDVKRLALADSLSEMLIAAEDGVLCIADPARGDRPATDSAMHQPG